MNRMKSKSKVDRTMPMVHPNAAAIDVGATMHMAAVGADRVPGASTQLRHLHGRSRSTGEVVCGMRRRDRRHGINQRLLDSDL